jgi:hypothetical protein
MAGSPIKREKRDRAIAILNSPNFMKEICEYVSTGGSLAEFAVANQIPYGRMHRFLFDNEERKAAVLAARHARAQWHVERMERLANHVEEDRIDPHAAKVASDIRRWVASRLDMQTYGDKMQAKVEFTDTTQLHLEAVRNLMRTVSVVEPEKLTADTATDAETTARSTTDANENENHSHLD